MLTAHTLETLDAPPVSHDYHRFDAASCWNAVGTRPASGSDHNLYLFAGSAFGDPDDHDELSSSTSGTFSVDLILVDRNHAPAGNYYPEVQQYSDAGVDEMRFSDDDTSWTSWEPYVTDKSWTLLSGDGPKTVYVQYRDHLGHVSSSYNDSIIMDTVPPISSASSPTSTTTLSFALNWSGTDNVSGIATYGVQYRVGDSGTWTMWLSATIESSAIFGPASPVTVVTEETYYFRVRARDHAGNLEAYPGGDGDTSTFVEKAFTIYLPSMLRSF